MIDWEGQIREAKAGSVLPHVPYNSTRTRSSALTNNKLQRSDITVSPAPMVMADQAFRPIVVHC
jgi:hypothetical protein